MMIENVALLQCYFDKPAAGACEVVDREGSGWSQGPMNHEITLMVRSKIDQSKKIRCW